MNNIERGLFEIRTHEDFLRKARADVENFRNDDSNPSAAMNSILSLHHLYEWVWACWLKGRHDVQDTLGISQHDVQDDSAIRKYDLLNFKKWLDKECPHFKLLTDLANGAKHCFRTKSSTRRVTGYGAGPYSVGPYGSSYLLIDLGDGRAPAERYLVVSEVLKETLEFWNSFFVLNVKC